MRGYGGTRRGSSTRRFRCSQRRPGEGSCWQRFRSALDPPIFHPAAALSATINYFPIADGDVCRRRIFLPPIRSTMHFNLSARKMIGRVCYDGINSLTCHQYLFFFGVASFCQLGLEKRDKVTGHSVVVTGLSFGDKEASRCVMTLLQSCTLTRATRRDGNSLVRFAAATAGHTR